MIEWTCWNEWRLLLLSMMRFSLSVLEVRHNVADGEVSVIVPTKVPTQTLRLI